MLYMGNTRKIDCQTYLAQSDNLLDWKPLAKMLSLSKSGWDQWQADGPG